MRMNLDEELATLQFCPKCGEALENHQHFSQQRSCFLHGDFTIKSVGVDGSIEFSFTTLPAAPVHRDNIESR